MQQPILGVAYYNELAKEGVVFLGFLMGFDK